MSEQNILLAQYINSVACLGLMAMIYSLAWVSSLRRNPGATFAMISIVIPLSVQVLTPLMPGLLPRVAWSGCALHTVLFLVCATTCRRELWALLRLKTHVPPPAGHPMRRPEDFKPSAGMVGAHTPDPV